MLAYAPQAALGAVQAVSALKGLNDLKKQALPKYDMTEAEKNVSMYQRRFDQGLSPEERAAMGQQFSSATAGFYRAASEQSKGSLSNFLGRISALDRIKYATQMGSMMAQEKRAAMGGLAGARNTLMGQQNRQAAYEMQRRDSAERALGGALQSGLYNVGTGLTYGLASFTPGSTSATGGQETQAQTQTFNPVGEPGSYNYSSPIGPRESYPNLMNLPPSMGGTNLKAGFMPQQYTSPNLLGLPPQMGGTSLEAGFMYDPYSTPEYYNLPVFMGGTRPTRFSTPSGF